MRDKFSKIFLIFILEVDKDSVSQQHGLQSVSQRIFI